MARTKNTKWENMVLPCEMNEDATSLRRELDRYGAEGWEVVAVRDVVEAVGSNWKWLVFMKRPFQQSDRGSH